MPLLSVRVGGSTWISAPRHKSPIAATGTAAHLMELLGGPGMLPAWLTQPKFQYHKPDPTQLI